MLGRKNYTQEEIDAGRAMVEFDLRAYRRLPAADRTKEFEAVFFNRAVLLLDYMFVHRFTGIEGKDGNPLNEVRILCNSILLNQGQAAGRQAPRVANVGRRFAQTAAGQVCAKAQGGRRGEAQRS
jgi:hypothetical protein